MGAPLPVELDAAGLLLPALGLHVDPHAPVARAFVSHAHGDHAGATAGETIASRETLALMEARGGPRAARALDWGDAVELPLAGGGAARVSIAPAGHVLGAAQLVVDHPGGRLVYTGDYRTGVGATHAEGAPVECDELVVESTFALPIFRFPDRDRVRQDLVAFCRARLDEGLVPVVLAYALGKAQSVIHDLVEAQVPVVAHGAAYKMCAAYEALGVPLGLADGRVRAYADEPKGKIKATLVIPPRAAAQMTKKRANAAVALVSGWALLDAQLERHRADAGFVLSDHADHVDLLETIEATGARRVYTTHGDAEALARILVRRGIDAVPLASAAIDEDGAS
jgi:putative mRNA 3-end processing factor